MPERLLNLSRSKGPIKNTNLVSWRPNLDTLVAKGLKPPSVGEKDGSYFVRGPLKEGCNKRADENIVSASLVVLDGDSSIERETGEVTKGAPDPKGVHDVLAGLGVPHFIFTTHSHGAKGKRYRVLIPAELANKAELSACVFWLIDQLHQAEIWLADVKENHSWSQAWFIRRRQSEESEYLFYHHDEGSLDVSACVAWKKKEEDFTSEIKTANQSLPAQDPNSPIGRYNAKHGSPEAMLKTLNSHGYKTRNRTRATDREEGSWRLLAPESESGEAGVVLCHGKAGKWVVFSHHGNDPLGPDEAGNCLPRDAFDLLRILEHDGDMDAALDAIRDEFPLEQDRGTAISNHIRAAMSKTLERKSEDLMHPKSDERIQAMLAGSFWSGVKSKLYTLNKTGDLVEFTEKDAYPMLVTIFGDPLNPEKLKKAIAELSKQDANTIRAISGRYVLSELKLANQRNDMAMRVDMFTERDRIEIEADRAVVIFRHKPIDAGLAPDAIDQRVIEDYKNHFPRIDKFIEFLVMSRFSADRKTSYLWIKAESDWGKGFLIGILKSMGLVVELSMKEIEKMFEGNPVGRSMKDFKRAIALVVDEFKTVKSELKQLQSTIPVSPKHQLTFDAEVFAKLFFSAESVGSLVGDSGIEDQFCNRINLYEESGSIVTRSVYETVGKDEYFQHVKAYVAGALNEQIEAMQKMGRSAACLVADQWLTEFIKHNSIANFGGRLSENLPDVAAEFRAWLGGTSWESIVSTNAGKVLKSPTRKWNEFVDATYSDSEKVCLKRKKEEVFRLLSLDGKTNVWYRDEEGKNQRGLLLTPDGGNVLHLQPSCEPWSGQGV